MKVLQSTAALRRQHGAVLIVALLFLVILTLLGLTAMSGTMMEERMSGNSRDMNVALQAAEAALRDARRDINRLPISGEPREIHRALFTGPSGTFGSCNVGLARGLCKEKAEVAYGAASEAMMPPSLDIGALHAASLGGGSPSYARYGDFTGAPQLRATVEGTGNRPLAVQPLYVIELFCLTTRVDSIGAPPGANCKFYRITARGYGVNPNSQVTLQEIFLAL